MFTATRLRANKIKRVSYVEIGSDDELIKEIPLEKKKQEEKKTREEKEKRVKRLRVDKQIEQNELPMEKEKDIPVIRPLPSVPSVVPVAPVAPVAPVVPAKRLRTKLMTVTNGVYRVVRDIAPRMDGNHYIYVKERLERLAKEAERKKAEREEREREKAERDKAEREARDKAEREPRFIPVWFKPCFYENAVAAGEEQAREAIKQIREANQADTRIEERFDDMISAGCMSRVELCSLDALCSSLFVVGGYELQRKVKERMMALKRQEELKKQQRTNNKGEKVNWNLLLYPFLKRIALHEILISAATKASKSEAFIEKVRSSIVTLENAVGRLCDADLTLASINNASTFELDTFHFVNKHHVLFSM